MLKKTLLLLVVLVLLSGCAIDQTANVFLDDETDAYRVDWKPINPPPTVDGPCWAYFVGEAYGNRAYGYSGVYCQP